MMIQPKVRGFICTTAHPDGCFQAVAEQINYIKSKEKFSGPINVLIIGASTGYGLASRITATYGASAKTIGVFYEKEADEKRTASPGWYNTAAFESLAHRDGYYAKSINGDAFSLETKQRTIELIQRDLQKIDLVIYSLASPRRTHPLTGQTYTSVLKPTQQEFTGKTVDAFRGDVKSVTISPATAQEIENTIAVMGGEDWAMWIDALLAKQLLAPNAKTIAYSYIGPVLTHAIYKDGTIGKAKDHLKKTADELNQKLAVISGQAFISVNKALVTQASAAIPVVPLYIALLYKVMKAKGIHEGCIEQIYRLFHDYLYAAHPRACDTSGFIRLDDLEMRDDVQAAIATNWEKVTSENVDALSDIAGYRHDFYRLFGFEMPNVDYTKEVNPIVDIPSIHK